MKHIGTAIASARVWAGTVALSALFLYYMAIAGIILLFWLTAIGLTIWLSQLKSDDS